MATNSRQKNNIKNMILKTNLNGDDDWQDTNEDEKKEDDELDKLGEENWGDALGDDEDDDFAN